MSVSKVNQAIYGLGLVVAVSGFAGETKFPVGRYEGHGKVVTLRGTALVENVVVETTDGTLEVTSNLAFVLSEPVNPTMIRVTLPTINLTYKTNGFFSGRYVSITSFNKQLGEWLSGDREGTFKLNQTVGYALTEDELTGGCIEDADETLCRITETTVPLVNSIAASHKAVEIRSSMTYRFYDQNRKLQRSAIYEMRTADNSPWTAYANYLVNLERK